MRIFSMPTVDFRSSRPRPKVWPRLLLSIGAVLALLSIAAGYTLHRGAKTALEAERGLQSTRVAADVVDAFVRAQDPPRWPSSWDELATIEYTEHPWINWPRDRTMIESRVAIDFSLTLPEVAEMTAAEFRGIEPKGPSYIGWQNDIRFLIETAKNLKAIAP